MIRTDQLRSSMVAPGAIVSRPFYKRNPYGEGYVIGRSHSLMSSDQLLFTGTYDERFQMSFPKELLVFDTTEKAKNYRIRSSDLYA